MKPIIVEMNEMTDSKEVYESRPNPFFVYFIYFVAVMFLVVLGWMYFSNMDVVVKGNGIFQGNELEYEINSDVTGKVVECNVKDGQYVNEGDVLYKLDIISLGDNIEYYQNELNDIEERIEILTVYEKSLDGDGVELDSCSDNKYYSEFINKRALLFASIGSNSKKNVVDIEVYQKNVDIFTETISQYENKVENLEKLKLCIFSRTNGFTSDDSYYSSVINSYISNYNLVASGYDTQIQQYQDIVDECDLQLIEKNNTVNSDSLVENELIIQDEKNEIDIIAKKEGAMSQIEILNNQKEQELLSMELQQIMSIEQQMESVNNTILSLQTNLLSAELQLEKIKSEDVSVAEEIYILTEKGNIANEILTYQNKKDEYEKYLNGYDIQSRNCSVKAATSGYFYMYNDIKPGAYIQEGIEIGKIYPNKENVFIAEIYVENDDIAKIKVGQGVKFEIEAYPSSEYGYFTGRIESIPKDISVNQYDGSAYYLVKVSCDSDILTNKNGKEATLINGMACKAKIIVDKENVLTYILKKLDFM